MLLLLRRRSCWKLVFGLSLACFLGTVVLTNVRHSNRNLRLIITAVEERRGLSQWSSKQARSAASSMWRRPEAVSNALIGDEVVSTLRNATPIEKTPMQRPKLKDPRGQGGDVDEVTAMLHNLDRCLSAANLTSYFTQMDFLHRAKSNAHRFITSLRQSIPTEFTSTYSSPCWESRLDMKTCGSENDLPCSFPWFGVEGHFGTQSYKLLLFSIDRYLFSALKNRYPVGFSSSLVCLPKVFLAGFSKCGSSYVYCLLQKFAGYSQSLMKEPHFWVPRGPFETHRFPHDDKDLTMYLVNFQPSVEVEMEYSFSLPIDGSPNLLFQWPQYRSHERIVNYCLIPAVLPQVLPGSKFIVVMRNPVDMLYSAFWFSCSDRALNLSRKDQLQMPHKFHKRALTKINMFKNCTHSAPVDKCMDDIFTKLNDSKRDCGRIRLEVGFYYLHIRKWLAVVPQKQFLFLTTEELKSPTNVEMKIFDFLDVGLHLHPQQGNAQDKNFCKNTQTIYDYHHDPELRMKDVTRKILTTFFKPYNRKLAALLHDDKYLWAHET